MLTKEKQQSLKEAIHQAFKEQPSISEQALFDQMFPDHITRYEFGDVFQYVRSGHYESELKEEAERQERLKHVKNPTDSPKPDPDQKPEPQTESD